KVCLASVESCVIIHYLKRKLHSGISLECRPQDLVPLHYLLQSMLKALDINQPFQQQCKLRAPPPSVWQAPKMFLLRRQLESRGRWSRHRPTLLLEFVITTVQTRGRETHVLQTCYLRPVAGRMSGYSADRRLPYVRRIS